LKGMAESRRGEGHRRVWLKCSKSVAGRTQVWPARAGFSRVGRQKTRSSPRKRGPRGPSAKPSMLLWIPAIGVRSTPSFGRLCAGTNGFVARSARLILIHFSNSPTRHSSAARIFDQAPGAACILNFALPGKEPRARGTPGAGRTQVYAVCANQVLGPTGLDASRHRGLSKSLLVPQVRQNQRRPARGVC
jgi:hypothetical protein